MNGRSFCLTFKLRVQQQNRVTAFGADKLIYATAGRLMRETGSRWGGDPRAFEINGVKAFRTCKALLEQSILSVPLVGPYRMGLLEALSIS